MSKFVRTLLTIVSTVCLICAVFVGLAAIEEQSILYAAIAPAFLFAFVMCAYLVISNGGDKS